MKLVKIVLVVSMLVGTLGIANADKVGVVSLQTVFQQAPQGQATLDKLKQSAMPQMNQLKKQQAQLASAVAEFNKDAPTLSAGDRSTQEASLTQEQQQFQQAVSSFRDSEAQQQQAAAQTFQTDLVNAIQTIAKSGSYDMIMTDQTVPYYNPSYDVSAAVVNLMKKM